MRGIIATTNAGYTIIEAAYTDTSHGYVIGKNNGNYVTWGFRERGDEIDFYHGHYIQIDPDSPARSRAKAYADFHERLAEKYREAVEYGY